MRFFLTLLLVQFCHAKDPNGKCEIVEHICDLKFEVDVTSRSTIIEDIKPIERNEITSVVIRDQCFYFLVKIQHLFPILTSLEISNTGFKEIFGYELKPFINLTRLAITNNELEFLQQDLLDHNTKLEDIDFSNNRISYIYAEIFRHLIKLKSLNLTGNDCISNAVSDISPMNMTVFIHEIQGNCSKNAFLFQIDRLKSEFNSKLTELADGNKVQFKFLLIILTIIMLLLVVIIGFIFCKGQTSHKPKQKPPQPLYYTANTTSQNMIDDYDEATIKSYNRTMMTNTSPRYGTTSSDTKTYSRNGTLNRPNFVRPPMKFEIPAYESMPDITLECNYEELPLPLPSRPCKVNEIYSQTLDARKDAKFSDDVVIYAEPDQIEEEGKALPVYAEVDKTQKNSAKDKLKDSEQDSKELIEDYDEQIYDHYSEG